MALPVALGAVIYLVFRSPSLLVFDWAGRIGVSALVTEARTSARLALGVPPDWLRFSLPDGLWVYALTAAMALVWSGRQSLSAFSWMAVGAGLGAGGELGQAVGVVPGTYDPLDLVFVLVGFAAALAFTQRRRPLHA